MIRSAKIASVSALVTRFWVEQAFQACVLATGNQASAPEVLTPPNQIPQRLKPIQIHTTNRRAGSPALPSNSNAIQFMRRELVLDIPSIQRGRRLE